METRKNLTQINHDLEAEGLAALSAKIAAIEGIPAETLVVALGGAMTENPPTLDDVSAAALESIGVPVGPSGAHLSFAGCKSAAEAQARLSAVSPGDPKAAKVQMLRALLGDVKSARAAELVAKAIARVEAAQ